MSIAEQICNSIERHKKIQITCSGASRNIKPRTFGVGQNEQAVDFARELLKEFRGAQINIVPA